MEAEVAVFGGGCFWCTEAVFLMLKGVKNVAPGYAGGTTENPTYYQVATGTTGHAEVIRVEYDPKEITYPDLLTVFFGSHDATQVNRQGADIGTQYRSLILYTTPAQKTEAEAGSADLNNSSPEGERIATNIEPLSVFYPAEKEHFGYYGRNQNQGYCQVLIAPKLQKVQERFAELLSTHPKT